MSKTPMRPPVVAVPENPSRIIVVFTSYSGSVGGKKYDSFQQRVQQLDPTVGIIGLYDSSRMFFMGGADTHDSMAETLEFLEAFRTDNKDLKISCVGYSAGGFGALQYAVHLGSDSVSALNPWTTVSDEGFDVDPRGGSVHDEIRATFPDGPGRDIKMLFEQNDYKGKVNIFYSGNSEGDAYQAERMKDFPYVTLYRTEASSHAQGANILGYYGPEYWQSLGLNLPPRIIEKMNARREEFLAEQAKVTA